MLIPRKPSHFYGYCALFAFSLCLIFITFTAFAGDVVQVKYRSTPVDLGRAVFTYHDTSESSWIEGAWYDAGNEYMIINLRGTYYHYCGVPESIWQDFGNYHHHGSYGKAYNRYLKGRFDCRSGFVPDY